MFELRPYQSQAFDRLREKLREGKRRLLLVSPTGSGKTVASTHIIKSAVEKGKDVLFVAHRREILFQTNRKLKEAGLDVNWIMSGMRKSAMAPVHLASIQTLVRRDFPNIGLIIWDEAHHCTAPSYKKVIDHYHEVPQIGLTATPCRADGNGLGGIFEDIVQAAYPSELIEQGYLVSTKIFAPTIPDLKGVRSRGGDYIESDLGEKMDKPKLIGDIIPHWEKLAQGRKTIVFAVTCSHAQHILEAFTNCGHEAFYVDGETPHVERKRVFDKFEKGENGVLVNVGIATEGYDNPAISCIVLARPTKSLGLYLQMAGRALRPADGKTDMLILDHSGASLTHGYPDEDRDWLLDDTNTAWTKRNKEEQEKSTTWVCGQCFYINKTIDKFCASCGLKAVKAAHSPKISKGDLKELQRKKIAKMGPVEKEKDWTACVFKASRLGLKIGAAAHMYRNRHGVWPDKGFKYMPKGKYEWNVLAEEFLKIYDQKQGNRTAQSIQNSPPSWTY